MPPSLFRRSITILSHSRHYPFNARFAPCSLQSMQKKPCQAFGAGVSKFHMRDAARTVLQLASSPIPMGGKSPIQSPLPNCRGKLCPQAVGPLARRAAIPPHRYGPIRSRRRRVQTAQLPSEPGDTGRHAQVLTARRRHPQANVCQIFRERFKPSACVHQGIFAAQETPRLTCCRRAEVYSFHRSNRTQPTIKRGRPPESAMRSDVRGHGSAVAIPLVSTLSALPSRLIQALQSQAHAQDWHFRHGQSEPQ